MPPVKGHRITAKPIDVYWSRTHGNTWEQVAEAFGISRSSAIALCKEGAEAERIRRLPAQVKTKGKK